MVRHANWTDSALEQRQNKNDSIWSKDKLTLNLPRFFTRLYGQWKRAVNSKLICSWTKWCHSYFVFALVSSSISITSSAISATYFVCYFCYALIPFTPSVGHNILLIIHWNFYFVPIPYYGWYQIYKWFYW